MLRAVERQVGGKADAHALAKLDKSTSGRLDSIESALLKGLKAVSEKAATALATKLAMEVRYTIICKGSIKPRVSFVSALR